MIFRQAFLFIIILSSLSYSVCSGEVTHPVVAVMGEGGSLVNLTMKVVPGSGEEYVGLLPYAGVSTQQSARFAIRYARAVSSRNTSDCDVLVSFGRLPSGDYVDGPSAGAAIAVLSYALFENVSVRNDTTVTGTLEAGGIVGPVGGLYEKAKGSAISGMKYFVTPFNNIYEFVTLEKVEDEYDIEVIQVKTMDDIIGFMLYDYPVTDREITQFESSISNDTVEYHVEGIEKFKDVALNMIEYENDSLGNMPVSGETVWINGYFNESIVEQLHYIDLGYYFTAANDAFLNYIQVSTINAVFGGDINLRTKRDAIRYCLDSVERPKMTEENFEWVVGSDLRKLWAEDKVNSTDIQSSILIEEKYDVYNSLMYADAWCRVSEVLADAADDNGTEINESAWKTLAEEKIEEADFYPHSEETAPRLKLARKSFSNGRYGAAIYDATYVIAMDEVEMEISTMSEQEINEIVERFSVEERTSLWGKIYHSQALFLIRQKNPNPMGALRLFVYAQALDESAEEMRNSMKIMEKGKEEGSTHLLILILIFLLFSFVLLFILPKIVKRRSYGNNGKRPGRVHRAKQKKAGTRTKKGLSGIKQKGRRVAGKGLPGPRKR